MLACFHFTKASNSSAVKGLFHFSFLTICSMYSANFWSTTLLMLISKLITILSTILIFSL